jgi:mercuric ion binding protein
MKPFFLLIFAALFSSNVQAQGCCSGGGGNPMAAGAATGVLQDGQFEIASSYKYSRSDFFLTKDHRSTSYFDNLTSNYLFFKVDYGITDKLTMSVAAGHYLNRTITEFADTTLVGSEMIIDQKKVKSSGWGDLIVFPRYNVFTTTKPKSNSELSIGLGWKIPIGSHNDSNFVGYSKFIDFDNGPPKIDSIEIWQTSPPTVQTTTGSHDFIFYGFYLKNYPGKNFRFFANALYVRKGWNSLGLKFGDYASFGFSAGATFFKKLGLLAQLKGEWVGRLKSTESIDILGAYSIEKESTGSYMVSIVPQIMYTFNKPNITLFATADIPMYQYMRGSQVANQHQITMGLSYRFFVKKRKEVAAPISEPALFREESFKVWGNCGMCKTTIEQSLMEIKGVTVANYDLEKQSIDVRFNSLVVSLDELQLGLAKVGYDTENHKATEKAYNSLHSCCKYDRN